MHADAGHELSPSAATPAAMATSVATCSSGPLPASVGPRLRRPNAAAATPAAARQATTAHTVHDLGGSLETDPPTASSWLVGAGLVSQLCLASSCFAAAGCIAALPRASSLGVTALGGATGGSGALLSSSSSAAGAPGSAGAIGGATDESGSTSSRWSIATGASVSVAARAAAAALCCGAAVALCACATEHATPIASSTTASNPLNLVAMARRRGRAPRVIHGSAERR